MEYKVDLYWWKLAAQSKWSMGSIVNYKQQKYIAKVMFPMNFFKRARLRFYNSYSQDKSGYMTA